MREHLYLSLKQQLKRLANRVGTAGPVVATATIATTMCVKAPDFRKGMLVRAKLQFEGFDNATQPQNHIGSLCGPSLLFPTSTKFTAEISENEITFLDAVVLKGWRFIKESILDIKTHYKPTETFQYTHFTSCHPPGVKRGFIKGEAIRLPRTNTSKTTFEECLANLKRCLEAHGYPKKYIESRFFVRSHL